VSSSPRQAVVEHRARLAILCCLNGKPLAVKQVSARTGLSPGRAKHHLRVLNTCDLVGRTRSGEGGETLYESHLNDQPEWVRKAVEGYQRHDCH
jgi:DNA-binding transcriptional ArsR family regulator